MFRQTLWPFLQPVRQRLCSVFQNQTGSTDETETEWLLYITRLLITRLITDLLNSSSVKIYNPVFCSRLCPGSKSPLCCWRQWGVYSPTGWDDGVFVQGQWSEWLGEHSGYSQVQYAKWECVREIILVCFEEAGWTDGVFVCGFTGLALAAAELPPTIPPDSSQSLLVAGNIEGWTERCGKEKGKTERWD